MINRVVSINMNIAAADVVHGIAGDIAGRLNEALPCDVVCECYNFCDIIEMVKEDVVTFDDETVVVIGVPSIRNRVPLPCITLLQRFMGRETMLVAIVTHEGRGYGNTLRELYGFVEAQGFKVVSAAAFVARQTENSLAKRFVVQRPDSRDFEMIKVFGTATTNKIKRLAGSEVELMRVKPAPLNFYVKRRSTVITVVGNIKRKDPEWFL